MLVSLTAQIQPVVEVGDTCAAISQDVWLVISEQGLLHLRCHVLVTCWTSGR